MTLPLVITAAILNDSLNDCATRFILPSNSCADPGFWPAITVFAVRLVYPKAQLKVISGSSYGLDGNTYNGSVLWLINHGQADITRPYFVLSAGRTNIPHTKVLYHDQQNFIFRKVQSSAKLQVFELGVKPFGLWIGLFFCLSTWYSLKLLLKTKLAKDILRDSAEADLKRRLRISLGFWAGIFLSGLSSYIVLLFANTEKDTKPISDFANLRRQLEQQRYKLILGSPISEENYFNHAVRNSLAGIRGHNPPIFVDGYPEVIRVLKNEKPADSPKLVGIYPKLYLDIALNEICDLDITEDSSRFGTPRTIYYRKGFNFSLTMAQSKLLEKELKKMSFQKFPRKFCSSKTGEIAIDEIDNLSFAKLKGAFTLFAVIMSACIVIFFVEFFFKHAPKFWRLMHFSNFWQK